MHNRGDLFSRRIRFTEFHDSRKIELYSFPDVLCSSRMLIVTVYARAIVRMHANAEARSIVYVRGEIYTLPSMRTAGFVRFEEELRLGNCAAPRRDQWWSDDPRAIRNDALC